MVCCLLFTFCLHSNIQARAIPPWIYFINIFYNTQPNQENTNVIINTTADKLIKLRIKKEYEVFNAKGKMVLKGSGKEIDINDLPDCKYTVKFDKDFNQIEYFRKVTPKAIPEEK